MIREATGDTEASFFAPGKGFVRELLEAKNHSLAPSEFWSEIDRFRALDSGSPETFHWFTLASVGLSEDLKPLANGLRRVRDPYGFYDPGSAIRENSYQDFVAVVAKLDRGADDARFIFEKVLIDWELGTAQGHGEALFREALPTRLPEFGHLSSMMLHDVYLGVVALLRNRLNKPIERQEIEAVLRSPIPADRIPSVRPVSLYTSSGIGETGPSVAIRFEWAPFFGGVAREFPGPDEWERRVMRELRETKEWIQAHRATRRVRLTGNRRLSASLAIGSVLSAVAGFAIEMEYRGGEMWSTDAHARPDTPSYPLDVPKDRSDEAIAHGIPITYVPARNTILLSLALAWAEALGAYDIFTGANCVDYSGYPDCRPEFFRAFETLANLATKAGVEENGRFRVHAPLLELSKEQIIRRGLALGVDYSLTHTCYDPTPDGLSCGRCDACRLRLAAFEKLGIPDPIPYAN